MGSRPGRRYHDSRTAWVPQTRALRSRLSVTRGRVLRHGAIYRRASSSRVKACSSSGTPVLNVETLDDSGRAAVWNELVAISRAVNESNTDGFLEAMRALQSECARARGTKKVSESTKTSNVRRLNLRLKLGRCFLRGSKLLAANDRRRFRTVEGSVSLKAERPPL